MTFDSQKTVVGRRPIVIVEIDLDACSLTYGVAPCTAPGGPGAECYNTIQTCQDVPNYTATTTTLRFCTEGPVIPGLDAFPCVSRVRFAPTVIQPGTFGQRASINITMQTFAHNDSGVDPYSTTRAYDASAQGDFFAKLKARNPFYRGRAIRVLEGYIGDPFSLADFQTRTFIIDRIDGPDANGRVQVVAKDPLKLADRKKAKCPLATDGVLQGDINASVTTIDVGAVDADLYNDPTGSPYPFIRINDEIMSLDTWRSTGIFDVTRAQRGTVAEEHDEDDGVQACYQFSGHPVDALRELLEDYTGIDPTWINTTDWDAEKTGPLDTFAIDGVVESPTGVGQLLDEILSQNGISMWWDDLEQEIRIRAISQFTTADGSITDDQIIQGSERSRDDLSRLLTRVSFWFNRINEGESVDAENSGALVVKILADLESAQKWNTIEEREVFSRWFRFSALATVNLITQRIADQFKDIPLTFDFALDAKDSTHKTGDLVEITSGRVQLPSGAAATRRFLIISSQPQRAGDVYRYTALAQPDGEDSENTVTVPTECLNVWTFLGSPAAVGSYEITIPEGVTIYSCTPGSPALRTDGFAAGSDLTINLEGDIVGFGGLGGAGGVAVANYDDPSAGGAGWSVGEEGPGSDGDDGTDAIFATIDIDINCTNGNIWGGGGGGGGSAGIVNNGVGPTSGDAQGGHGGGGGASFTQAAGGAGGDARIVQLNFEDILGTGVTEDGTPGAAGTSGGGGAGGVGLLTGTPPDGGAGGAHGAAGSAGSGGNAGSGGAAGKAIELNGNAVTFSGESQANLEASNQIRGAVS